MAHSKSRRAVRNTLERRDASRDWLDKNFFDEWEEVFRFYKARTEPIVDEVTKKEDTSRTNVCMPDYWIIGRRKATRMASRPPSIRIGTNKEELSEFLSHWTAFQWDRAGEQKHQTRHVLQAELLGLSIKRHWWDEIVETRRFRRSSRDLLEKFGVVVEEDELTEETKFRAANERDMEEGLSRSLTDFASDIQANILTAVGPETVSPTNITRYEGPVSSFVFLGDFYPEPEFTSLHESAWIITEDIKNLEWLLHFAELTYTDPDGSGQEIPVFDKRAVQKLLTSGKTRISTDEVDSGSENLKTRLRDAIFKDRPNLDPKIIPGKRFHIIDEHTFRDGWPWVRWVANEDILLGEMPYPWDLYGRYGFSSLTPIPDLLWGIGDSSPRILRHLMKLHNVTVGQRTDLLNQILKPLLLLRKGADLPSEVIDRGLMRILEVNNFNDYKFEDTPRIPPDAWQQEAQILRMLQLGEPALTDFGAQTQGTPETQKVATLALLQQRAGESLSSDELQQLSESISDETTIKLHMLQQAQQGELEVPPRYFSSLRSQDGGGQAVKSRMDPLELQEDFEVFPEMGSTLALDDIDRRRDAVTVYQVARENAIDATGQPVWDVREAARRLASTFRGRGSKDLILEQQPPRPDEGPKVSVSVSINYKDLEADLKQFVRKFLGAPPSDSVQITEMAEQVMAVSEAGAAAQELTGEAQQQEAEDEAARVQQESLNRRAEKDGDSS
ncbi:MAG: hypothetical protein V3W37_10400 [Candidatus Binatia bacterium]